MDEVNQPVPPAQTPDQMHSSFEEPHNSKVIPFIIIAVLLILVGVGSYVLGTKKSQPTVENKVASQPSPTSSPTPTPNPTSNWKTYTNSQYGFSFKYPTDLDIALGKNLQKNTQLTLYAYNPENYFELNFLISAEPVETFAHEYGQPESDLVTIIFNDIVAQKSSGYGGDGGWVYQEYVTFTHDGLTYNFGIGTADRKNLLNQILSTFQFSP